MTIVFLFAASSDRGQQTGRAENARTPNSVLHAIEARYHSARTLQAKFLEMYSEGGKLVRLESGTASFARPGRMRWDYEEPEKKLFLVDGAHVWFYVPSDRTVTRAAVKQSTDWKTPIALLAGKGNFSRACKAVEWIGAAGLSAAGRYSLRCLPKSRDLEFREIVVEADSHFQIRRIVIREMSDVETEFQFADWAVDVSLSEALFHFQPPPGVAIVDEKLPGSIVDTPRSLRP